MFIALAISADLPSGARLLAATAAAKPTQRRSDTDDLGFEGADDGGNVIEIGGFGHCPQISLSMSEFPWTPQRLTSFQSRSGRSNRSPAATSDWRRFSANRPT